MLYLRGMSRSHGYFVASDAENSGLWVYEVERLLSRSTWPAYIPSFYGSEPPMSNRIIQTLIRVLTSFVPPIHNQGVSLAPLQGRALWKKFLPTTGSFFVFKLLTCIFTAALFSVDVCLLHYAFYPAPFRGVLQL